jgi:hypothetical protein
MNVKTFYSIIKFYIASFASRQVWKKSAYDGFYIKHYVSGAAN